MIGIDSTHLVLNIKPSRIGRLLLLASHCLAILALWMSGLHWLTSAGLSLAVCVHGSHYLIVDPNRTRGQTLTAVSLQEGQWLLHYLNKGERQSAAAVLSGQFRLTSWFVSVQFRELESGRTRDLALFADSADPDQLRRFRVWLRLGARQSENTLPTSS